MPHIVDREGGHLDEGVDEVGHRVDHVWLEVTVRVRGGGIRGEVPEQGVGFRA